MATQTRPFLTAGAALVSAAAIVAASPGIAPSASIATPNALSKAAYELTTFADVFTIPAAEWTNLLFYSSEYGGFVGPENEPLTVEPWASYCNYECTVSGISGALYLGLDALVNGNGNGWDDRDNWGVGIVNYLFEPTFARAIGGGGGNFTVQTGTAGLSAATAYLLQATFGQASPILSTFIQLAFYGPYLVTIAWEDFLAFAASAVSGVPVIGPFIADSITAYAGELPAPGYIPVENEIYYTAGLSGVLQYWINTLTGATGQQPQTSAAVAAPARVVASVAEAVAAPAVEAAAPAAEAVEEAQVEVPATASAEVSATVDTPAAEVPESAPAQDAVPTAADVKADAAPVDSSSSAVAEATAEATSEEAAAPAPAPSKATSKRPVRDAIAKVTKSITSAVDSVKAGATSAPAETADAG
ncbi:MAG: hypothetical protein FGM50_01855 [Mycobacterium sp.]|nr:hypothetical protein [Mycobacterium sp.]